MTIRTRYLAGVSALAIALCTTPASAQVIPVEPVAQSPAVKAPLAGQEDDAESLRRAIMRLSEQEPSRDDAEDAPIIVEETLPAQSGATAPSVAGPVTQPAQPPAARPPAASQPTVMDLPISVPAQQPAEPAPVNQLVSPPTAGPVPGTGAPGRPAPPKPPASAPAQAVVTPPVDAQILRQAREGAQKEEEEDIFLTAKDNILEVRPGETQLVAVAHGHLNRFITPFAEANVVTTSDAKFQVSGNVVYVSATAPATLFITAKGDESLAIGIGVVPRKVPPREITLRFADGVRMASPAYGDGNARADRFERNQPFVDTVRAVMRDIAAGKLPPGYSIHELDAHDTPPLCLGPEEVAYHFQNGQVLSGANFDAVVGTVTNLGLSSIELVESWCGTSDVAAVAYWPHVLLEPGQMTEVYVLRRPGQQLAPEAIRPSLIPR